MADIAKCKDCEYYRLCVDYYKDPRGLLYDACMCEPHWYTEIRVALRCPLDEKEGRKHNG